jgi:hypothetical protein
MEAGLINVCFNGCDHPATCLFVLIRCHTIAAKQKQAHAGIEKKKKSLGKEMN